MFNKKARPLDTITDLRIKNLVDQITDEKWALMSAVENCIVRNSVIDLYPDGADKDKAIKDADKAKYSLLCQIGIYDGLMQEYNEALASKNDRCTTVGWRNTFNNSHKLVEIAYRNFYKGQ